MRAWLFQDHRQKKKLGDKCPWSVGWVSPDGKRKSKKIGSKSLAEKFARRIEGQLAAGTYENTSNKKWVNFRREFEAKGMTGTTKGSQGIVLHALDKFQQLIQPVKVAAITTRTIAEFAARRQAELSRKDGPRVSPATVNRDLRNLRIAIRKAHKWGYLPKLPEFQFLKEPGKLTTYVSPEHFAKLYEHAGAARWPEGGPVDTAEWWRAMLVTAYLTGWRIGALMALRWEDVNLSEAWAISRAEDNKGKRDQRIPLHPVIVSHLRRLKSFSPRVFAWNHPRKALFEGLHAIQKAAGIKPEGPKALYGFHDLRRAFATMNADKLTPDALQALMQHKDYQTTQCYINMARQLNPAIEKLYVPDVCDVSAR